MSSTGDVCPLFFAMGAPGALTETFTQAGFVDATETRITDLSAHLHSYLDARTGAAGLRVSRPPVSA